MKTRLAGRSVTSAASGVASLAAVSLAVAACASTPEPARVPELSRDECPPATGQPRSRDTVTLAVTEEVRPSRAPRAASASERLVFRQLYGALVEVDCRGRILPGLAESWEPSRGGLVWTFRLRPGARFWDGRPLYAGDVAASWRRLEEDSTGAWAGPGAPVVRPSSVVAVDSLRLVVRLPRQVASPAVFAAPGLAVAGSVSVGGWPAGTAPHQPAGTADRPEGGPSGTPFLSGAGGRGWTQRFRRHPPDGGAPLRLRVDPGADGRDLLDAGVDLLLTRDARTLSYADGLPSHSPRPLPWDRVYVLAPGRGSRARPGAQRPPADSAPTPWRADGRRADPLHRLRRSLVRTVEPEPRPARPPYWWAAGPACGTTAPGGSDPAPSDAHGPSRGPPSGRPATPAPGGRENGAPTWVVYPREDAAARGLAARLVALAGMAGGEEGAGDRVAELLAPRGEASRLRAVGLTWERFSRALERGRGAGFVFPLPRRVLDRCSARARLARAIPWLAGLRPPGPGTAETRARGPGGATPAAGFVALVETRPWLVARAGLTGLELTWEGLPLLSGAGWEAPTDDAADRP